MCLFIPVCLTFFILYLSVRLFKPVLSDSLYFVSVCAYIYTCFVCLCLLYVCLCVYLHLFAGLLSLGINLRVYTCLSFCLHFVSTCVSFYTCLLV